MKQLMGKTALLTGASRGIGASLAVALADQGMNLVLSARSREGLTSTLSALRPYKVRVEVLPADLRQRDEVTALAEGAMESDGGVDVLINNAAIDETKPYEHVSPAAIAEIMEINLVAPMTLTRLLLPHMIRRGEGHVVNISSLAGMVGTPYNETYAATKHGLVGFSRSLRLSLEAENYPIGVSVICPAFVEEAGMYHEASSKSGAPAPFMLGTVGMRRVTKAVVRAIQLDKPEVVLTGKPIVPFLLTQTVAPGLANRLSALVGVPAMFKKWSAVPSRSNSTSGTSDAASGDANVT